MVIVLVVVGGGGVRLCQRYIHETKYATHIYEVTFTTPQFIF